MKINVSRLLASIFFCFSLRVFAETPAATGAVASAAGPIHNSGAVVQMFLGLFAVLLLIFALAWLLRKVGQGGLLSNPHLKVMASLALGPRERLVVVAAGSQQLLLGVAPGRISTLHVFDEPIITAADTPASSEFAKKIHALMNKSAADSTSEKP